MKAQTLQRGLLSALLALLGACEAGVESASGPSDGGVGADAGDLEIGQSAQALTLPAITPNADTTIRSGTPISSYGKDGTLGVTAASVADVRRSIVKFPTPSIPAGNVVHSARIDMRVRGISAGWLGGSVDIHRMTQSWQEGNGGWFPSGATWLCANDTDTGALFNFTNDCTAANDWWMEPGGPVPQPYVTEATDRAPVFTGGGGSTLSFDVTADVQRFVDGTANHGWMLAGPDNLVAGEYVNFYSRETSSRPTLVVEYGPDACPADPSKGLPGTCGCGVPDRDTNLDGVIDCFDGAVTADADTTLRLAIPFGNDGAGVFLGATSTSIIDLERALVKVDTSSIGAAAAGRPVERAYLEMTVAGLAAGWAGGYLNLHRMNRDWVEGNPPGNGATWVCANDTNTGLFGLIFNNCGGGDNWGMQLIDPFPRPFDPTPSANAPIFTLGTRYVRFDVTDDVNEFLANPSDNHGWLVQGAASSLFSGNWINFGSRETGAPPRLLLELGAACPPGSAEGKTEPGLCGCLRAETNSDTDPLPDCLDQCPNDGSKTEPGVCGCGNSDGDSDGDCLPDCIDPCPDDADTSAGGQCGCPSDPVAAGVRCADGLSGDVDVCDGSGHCGDPMAYSPDPSCSCTLVNTEQKTYWFCPCATSHAQAGDYCESIPDEYLVEIEDQTENALIAGCLDTSAWTGANDRTTEADWMWNEEGPNEDKSFWEGDANGQPHYSRYNNWREGQPGSADCGAMSADAGEEGKWFASGCGGSLAYVCEQDRSTMRPDSPTSDTGSHLGLPDNDDDPGPCTPEDEVWDVVDIDNMTEAEIEAYRDQLVMDAEACLASAEANQATLTAPACEGGIFEPELGESCSDLDPAIDSTEPGVVCHLDLPDNYNTSSLTLCSDHITDTPCAAGEQCGYAARCSNCDPSKGPCPLCLGDNECGVDGRCMPFMACGTPNCQYYCTNELNTQRSYCRFDSDCPVNGEECGWSSRCSKCEDGLDCPDCASPGADECEGEDNQCIQYRACGVSNPDTCFKNDKFNGDENCSEVYICGTADFEQTVTGFDEEPSEIPDQLTQENFPPPEEPESDPTEIQFPEIDICPDPLTCGSQGFGHPYCNYGGGSDLTKRTTDRDAPGNTPLPDKNAKAGDPGGSGTKKISFEAKPHLKLDFDVKPGPLGLVFPRATAEAAFSAKVEVNNVLKVNREFTVIDIGAGLSVGLQPDDPDTGDVDDPICGVNPGATRIKIFGMDLLPAGFLDDLRIPEDTSECEDVLEKVNKFQTAVDRAKKAFFDAQTLITEYYERADNGETFAGPPADLTVPSLCMELVGDPPPLNFPSSVGPCETEAPEDTINRFIGYYNAQLTNITGEALDKLVTELNGLLSSASSVGKQLEPRYPDGDRAFNIRLANFHDLEEIHIVNQTFFIGPIPCLLQVMFTVEYGFNLNVDFALRPGEALRQALAIHPNDQHMPLAEAGLTGTPYAQAGIGLFVGVGFDIGIVAASVGVQGNLSLGRVSLPVWAGAGIQMETKDDRRLMAVEKPDYLDALLESDSVSPSSSIGSWPVREFTFKMVYRYGADLKLNNILAGSIDLRVRLKFFFFSKTWRRTLVKFEGIAEKQWTLFSGKSRDVGDWGTIQMPMPFFQLNPIRPSGLGVLPSMPVFTPPNGYESFLYDEQCGCIENYNSSWSDTEKAEVRECNRVEDCCNTAGRTCFKDPAENGKGFCSLKRQAGTWGGTNGEEVGTLGESCVVHQDCVSGARCLRAGLINDNWSGPNVTTGICMPPSSCWGGPCDTLDDCEDDADSCSGNSCSGPAPACALL